MAVLQDPQGAVFSVWQPGESFGAELVNVAGALTWNELGTTDIDGARRFYEAVFGWSSEPMDTGGGPVYAVVMVGERINGGIREQGAEERSAAPPYWMPYLGIESADASAERAAALGGSVLLPPMDIPSGGRIAAIADPQGAALGLWAGEMDD
jgi:predicted enzyme related to lactoylglutathione lyase